MILSEMEKWNHQEINVGFQNENGNGNENENDSFTILYGLLKNDQNNEFMFLSCFEARK